MARGSNSREGRTARSERAKQSALAEGILEKKTPSKTYKGELRNFRDFNPESGRMNDYWISTHLIDLFNIREAMQKRLLEDYYEKSSNEDDTFNIEATVSVPFKGATFTFEAYLDASGMGDKQVEEAVKGIFDGYGDNEPLYGMRAYKS